MTVVSCAPHNPFDPLRGCRDLTQANTETAIWFNDDRSRTTEERTFWPATYFNYNSGDVLSLASYSRIEIRSGGTYAGGPGRTDCANPLSCTYQEELQNFANWYTYFRSRILLARAGIGRAFARQGGDIRVGYSTINQGPLTIDGTGSPGTVTRGLRPFTGSDREAFF